jgi:cytochrome c553
MNAEPVSAAVRKVKGRHGRWSVILGGMALLVGVLILANVTPAAAQNADETVALGKRIWKDKIACNACHGWSGNGVPDDSRMPVGANLRATKLNHAELVEVVKCGRPGAEMPHFDARAYEDKRCYDVTAADLGDKVPPYTGTGLLAREIEAVVAYVEAKMVGRGAFTLEDCQEYFGATADVCKTYTYGAH